MSTSRRVFVHAVLVGALALGQQAGAQEDEPAGGALSSGAVLDEIIVTAERREGRLQDVPFTVSAQLAADLERAGVTNSRDLQIVVSGLTWNSQGAWAQPNLRGVTTQVASPGSASPIAMYVDGVYQPSQSGTMLELPDVSRIEVLKGPQGTLFGRNATGGAIQIFTRDPEMTPGGRLTASYGRFSGGGAHDSDHMSFKGFVTGGLTDSLAASLSVYYDDIEGYVKNIMTGRQEGGVENAMVRGKLLWTISDRVDVLLTGFYSERKDFATEAGVPVRGITAASLYPDSIIPRRPWQSAYDAPAHPQFFVDVYGGSVRVTADLDGLGTLTSLSGYTKVRPRTFVDVDGAYAPGCLAAFGCIDYRIRNPSETVSQELNFASEQFGRFRFVAGLFAFYDKASEFDRVNTDLFVSDSHIWTRAYAAYSEGEMSVTDRLTAVLGLRYGWESKYARGRFFDAPFMRFADEDWDSITSRFSLRYEISDALNAYFTYSEGFKGGVVATQFNTAPPADPEELKSFEIGLKYARRNLTMNASAFYYDYEDLQQLFYDGITTSVKNAATAEIFGVDLDATAQLTPSLLVKFTASWMPRARFDSYPEAIAYTLPLTPFGLQTVAPYDASGTRLLASPKLTSGLTAQYDWHLSWGLLQTMLTAYYSSDYRLEVTGRVGQDAYATLGAQVSAQPAANDRLRITLYGKNLTNEAYHQGALLSGTSDIMFYAPPREIGLSLDYSF